MSGFAFAAALLGLPAELHSEPPIRAARVSFSSGQAWLLHATSQEWVELVLNYPVTTGDWILSDAAARTELHVGDLAVRLAGSTLAQVVQVEDDRVELSLSQGTMIVTVRAMHDYESLVLDMPSGTATIRAPGEYRVDVDTLRSITELVVHRGSAQVSAQGQVLEIGDRQEAYMVGDPTPSLEMRPAPGYDEFDHWASDRDRAAENSESVRYISNEMTGYEDLDRYGAWRNDPAYGAIWVPSNVPTGWAPYRSGYWAWVDPWGWTWIASEPWGFAPYHYGRWAVVRGSWAWVPGARILRPVYAPALVVFVGGGGWAASQRLGTGAVAWFPLAPGERWVPPYHVDERYRRRVNGLRDHDRDDEVVTGYYRNREVPGSVTAVSHDVFVSSRPRNARPIVLSHEDLGNAPVVGALPPVAPRYEPTSPGHHGRDVPDARPADHVVSGVRAPVHASSPAPASAPVAEHPAARPPGTRIVYRPPPEVTQTREVERQQTLEHAQLQERHERERETRPMALPEAELKARQDAEMKQLESRHEAQLRELPARATAAPRPMASTSAPRAAPPTPPQRTAESPKHPDAAKPATPPKQKPPEHEKPQAEGKPPRR